MEKFQLTASMQTMGGVFYPKGYAFIMFPDAEAATQVANALDESGLYPGEVMLLDPRTVLRDIGRIDGDSDLALPSVGTEGATVRKYVDLAREGHHAVMVRVANDEDTERIMQLARKAGFSYGQRYHLLAIEDLE